MQNLSEFIIFLKFLNIGRTILFRFYQNVLNQNRTAIKPRSSNLAAMSDPYYPLSLCENVINNHSVTKAPKTNRLTRKTAACKIIACGRRESVIDLVVQKVI